MPTALPNPWPERPRRHLDARREPALGVPGRRAHPLPEVLDVIERDAVAGEVQQAVEQHRRVPGRQHEAVAVGPRRIGGIVLQNAVPEHVRHQAGAHRRARVPRVRLLHRVDRQRADRVDAEFVERSVSIGSIIRPPWLRRSEAIAKPDTVHAASMRRESDACVYVSIPAVRQSTLCAVMSPLSALRYIDVAGSPRTAPAPRPCA